MKATKINASDLRIQMRDVIERVRFRRERFEIQIFGKPAAILIGMDEYNALLQSVQKMQARSVGDKDAS